MARDLQRFGERNDRHSTAWARPIAIVEQNLVFFVIDNEVIAIFGFFPNRKKRLLQFLRMMGRACTEGSENSVVEIDTVIPYVEIGDSVPIALDARRRAEDEDVSAFPTAKDIMIPPSIERIRSVEPKQLVLALSANQVIARAIPENSIIAAPANGIFYE